MKNGIVAAAIAVGAIALPASAALAQTENCDYPETSTTPTTHPIGWVLWTPHYADYMVCVITH